MCRANHPRPWAILLAAIVHTLTLGPHGASAAVFVVDTTNDLVDAAPGDGGCVAIGGGCTLRAAIQEANALPGDDAVTLPAGTYTLTIAGQNENAGTTGDLDISSRLSITGAGAAATIVDGNAIDRVFEVFGAVTVSGLTVRGGKPASGCGGGILHELDTLSLTDVILTANQAPRGGGICNGPVAGTAVVAMTNVVVSGNTALTTGGGILNDTVIPFTGPPLLRQGKVTLTESVVAANHAIDGAGIAALSNVFVPLVELVRSTVRANTATGKGGGLFDSGNYGSGNFPALYVVQSTISGNAAAAGGGIYGGALLEDSTLSGNSSHGDGGGLLMANGGTCEMRDTTITANVADDDANGSGDGGGLHITAPRKCVLENVILAGNQDAGGEGPECAGGDVDSAGHNLLGSAAGCLVAGDETGNVAGLDPKLGPLAANGGPTFTHALLPGSPALDAGLGCSVDDQRGIPRPQGTACDIGAVEQPYVATSCGNGALDGGESCDDGNVRDGDCCDHLCQLESLGSVCSDGNPCTNDACDGTGTCAHADNAAPCTDGSVCTPGAETCGGGICVTASPLACDDGNACTSNSCDAVTGCFNAGLGGMPCDDQNQCTAADQCQGDGSCHGTPTTGSCDDDDACTLGDYCHGGACVPTSLLSCPATCEFCDTTLGCTVGPRPDCQSPSPGAAHLQIKDASNDKSDGVLWNWAARVPAFIGWVDSGPYEMCVFDETAGSPNLVYGAAPGNGICGDQACWNYSGHGNTYRDMIGSTSGITSIKLIKSGAEKILIKLKAKGVNVSPPPLPLAQDPRVTAEFRQRNGGCWSSTFHTVQKNGPGAFKAKSD